VILVDTNLLVYAAIDGFTQHRRAHAWLEEKLHGRPRVGLAWESLVAFLRLATNPRIVPRPDPVAAWLQVERWLDAPPVWVPGPTERHRETLSTLLALTRATGPDVHDTQLAAIALQHGLTVCSADSDFARFPGLTWENPLAA
jgi:toxin-antitoxin system PIN domain toxin